MPRYLQINVWKKISEFLSEKKSGDTHKKIIGDYGESIAIEHLKQKGYQFIERNYRTPFGEIDIVMRDKTQLVFVEVKSRNEKWQEFGLPEDAVNIKKRNRIRRLAQYYINRHRNLAYTELRFDIISIILDQQDKAVSITHLPEAFK